MKDRLFNLFFACTIVGTFTFGFTVGKRLQTIDQQTTAQVNRVTKVDNANMTLVAKNP